MTKRLPPTGIIDIGSNSVRFVAYGGNARVPSHLFNEKISPALGKGVAANGLLDEKAMKRSLAALARFRLLSRDMGLEQVHTVATAAVREAGNGADFIDQVANLGLTPRILTGEEEAEMAAFGVISSIPGARGIAADLGGGSLELTRIAGDKVGARVSLPLGVLRVGREPDGAALRKAIRRAIKENDLALAEGEGLYLVGGSFRAIARLDLHDQVHPLPIVHQHQLTEERIGAIAALVKIGDSERLKSLSGLSQNRVDALPAALGILRAMIDEMAPSKVVVSTFGLREGLLYSELDPATRGQDPLLAAALEVGEMLGRFGDHGATIDEWIDPLFPDDHADARRYRLAACLMCDFAWNAHPDFRAERAVDMALHGNWVGIDAHGRALLGQALSAAFASENGPPAPVLALLNEKESERAITWGRAIRLAQRISGGTEAALLRTAIGLDGGQVVLSVPRNQEHLVGEMAEKRLAQLARLLGRDSRVDLN